MIECPTAGRQELQRVDERHSSLVVGNSEENRSSRPNTGSSVDRNSFPKADDASYAARLSKANHPLPGTVAIQLAALPSGALGPK